MPSYRIRGDAPALRGLKFKRTRHNRHWTPMEDEMVRRIYPLDGPGPLVVLLKRVPKAIVYRAYVLGVKYQKPERARIHYKRAA